ncbi:hypothetical protein FB451DRAFT_1184809 [Mycena latifolia]|nr:hypothetical protein FB451DRAFT_1184809 [Mycena latifolia]
MFARAILIIKEQLKKLKALTRASEEENIAIVVQQGGETVIQLSQEQKNRPLTHSNQNAKADEHTIAALPPFPDKYTSVRIETEEHANCVLKDIRDGAIGFDTEFTERRPREEKVIESRFGKGTAARRAALLGWQIVELSLYHIFPIAWDHIGLPSELRRILLSPRIRKVGVGLPSDILVIWDDLRLDMKNLTDAGLMAKLAIADRYPKQVYGNLCLKTSIEEVLGYKLPKDLTNSNWSAKGARNKRATEY